MYSMLYEENDINQERSIVSFDSIDWDKYRDFNKRYSFIEYIGCSIQILKKLARECLMDLQTRYYNEMLEKESREFFLCSTTRKGRGSGCWKKGKEGQIILCSLIGSWNARNPLNLSRLRNCMEPPCLKNQGILKQFLKEFLKAVPKNQWKLIQVITDECIQHTETHLFAFYWTSFQWALWCNTSLQV